MAIRGGAPPAAKASASRSSPQSGPPRPRTTPAPSQGKAPPAARAHPNAASDSPTSAIVTGSTDPKLQSVVAVVSALTHRTFLPRFRLLKKKQKHRPALTAHATHAHRALSSLCPAAVPPGISPSRPLPQQILLHPPRSPVGRRSLASPSTGPRAVDQCTRLPPRHLLVIIVPPAQRPRPPRPPTSGSTPPRSPAPPPPPHTIPRIPLMRRDPRHAARPR